MRRSTSLFVLVAVLLVGLGVYLAPLDPNILHLQFTFSEQPFNAVLSKWQSIGLARYKSHFPADFLLLVAYGVLGWRYGREHAPVLTTKPRLVACLTWALPLAAVADTTENVLHIVLTGANSPTSPALNFAAGSASSIKWFGIGIFFCCLGGAALARSQRAG